MADGRRCVLGRFCVPTPPRLGDYGSFSITERRLQFDLGLSGPASSDSH